MELLEPNGPVAVQQPAAQAGTARSVTANIDIKKEVFRILRKWPWFLLSMVLCYAAAKLYLRYQLPMYRSQTTLQMNKTKAENPLGDLKSMGMGVGGDEELITETSAVVAKPILERVAKNLNLQVAFYSVGRVKETELYKDAPLEGKVLEGSPKSFYAAYIVEADGRNGFVFKDTENEDSQRMKGRFGIPFKIDGFTAMLVAKPGFVFRDKVKVVFQGLANAAGSLEGGIQVSIPPDKGLLMDVSMVGPVPEKSEDILNEVARQYNIEGVLDKNAEAKDTERFIEERLGVISGDLAGIENQKAGFKQQNQITDLEAQASQSVGDMNEYTKKAVELNTQLDLVNSMLSATNTDGLLPSGMGAPAGVDAYIGQYNELLLTRSRTLKQATTANPAVIEQTKQLSSLKNLIRKNLIESRETLQLQLGQANARLNLAKGAITKFPEQEKIFRSIDRQQNIKEQLYLFLLQKREENAITLSVKAPKAKVLNPAYTTGLVSPNYAMITNGALGVGFLLPLLFFVGGRFLDTKIYSKENILAVEAESTVIAEIPVHPEEALVGQNDFSVFAESFRILASNLKFLLKTKNGSDRGVVVVTSSVKGEGKTTVSMNTALTLAGKNRTIIVGADIRNPQLHRFTGDTAARTAGLTDYLVSEDATPEAFIQSSGIHPNMDVLYGGQMAPNPSDLLDMDKFDSLMEWLRGHYHYIVVDTAPVMLVSDTLQVLDQADTLLYVVRAGETDKEMIHFAAGFRASHQIANQVFVINGVNPRDSRYGNKYGNKYGYGYYSYVHAEKLPWWKRFLK